MDIFCTSCNAKIGEYVGPIGWNVPIIAEQFTRIDGSQPVYDDPAREVCPICKKRCNEIVACSVAISTALLTEAETNAPSSDSGKCATDNEISDVREAPQDPSP